MGIAAPVTQGAAPGEYVVQFVLPTGVALATAPEPIDRRVTLRPVPASRVAVIRSSGFWSDGSYNKHLALLKDAQRANDVTWSGEPVYSRYSPPFMP